jgi:nicotinamidase-related amidase
MTTSSYEELKMKGPPLYNQGDVTVVDFDKVEETTIPLDAGRTALLVVDVQPEYWSECPAVRQDFPDFPNHLSNLVDICRRRRAKVIWVRADYRFSHSPWLLQFHRLHKGAIPPEVHSDPEEATKWEEFAQPLGGEFVIPKTSWSSTSGTCLMDLLQQSGIDTVLVCGLITSVCVQHSAFGIFEAGYRTVLVTDACADRGRARHEAALALYGDYMYELKTVAQVEQELQPAKPVWLIKDKLRRGSAPLNSLQDYIVWNDELTRS